MSFRKIIPALLIGCAVFASCEDPDEFLEPVNPDLAVDAVVGTNQSAARLINGCERQLAITYQELVTIAELTSDNYVNTQTFFNQFLDGLEIDFQDADINALLFAIGRLRAVAELGINVVGPADPGVVPDQIAQFHFFRGYAQLLAGSYYTQYPGTPGGALLSQSQMYDLAIADFDQALDLATEAETTNSLLLARARAHYQNGNCSQAVDDAEALLAADPGFLRYVEFDVINGPVNEFQDAIFDRGTFDDLQPLPRLDFLDPKYNNIVDPTNDYNIAYLKAEEARFILAEADLSSGEVDEAKEQMQDALRLIATRPVATFSDAREARIQDAPRSRPDTSLVTVASASGEDFISGLVLNRQSGPVTIAVVSGTSIDSARVADLDDVEDALELLYLMRQEVFIGEARRMVDLGISFVISENELLLNENVTEAATEPKLPEYIVPFKDEVDDFNYNPATGEVIIAVDFNKVIVDNRTSDAVVPCF